MAFVADLKISQLQPGQSRPLYNGGRILQFERLYRDVTATETVIVNSNPESPIFAIIIEHSLLKRTLSIIPRTDGDKTIVSDSQALEKGLAAPLSGSKNAGKYTPVDTYKWLAFGLATGKFKRDENDSNLKVPEYCDVVFYNPDEDGPLSIHWRDFEKILDEIRAIGFSESSVADKEICQIARLLINNIDVSTSRLEKLDERLGTKLSEYPNRAGASAFRA